MKTLIVLALAALMIGCGHGVSAGSGKKIGQIVKIGKTGVFCPTWEAELVRGGFTNTSGVNGTAFDFTIDSDIEAKILQEAMENRLEIELSYDERSLTGPCTSETNYFFRSAKVIGENQSTTYGDKSPAVSGSGNVVDIR